MAPRREIRPNDLTMECAVCGRTLLRGEQTESYIHAGQRRTVCELCTGRAEREGWIREAEGAQVGARARVERRSLFKRLRERRERAGPPLPPEVAREVEATVPEQDELYLPEPRSERHVHAVPTSDELKITRALELFNASEHPRTVAGVARSLGPPTVSVRPVPATSFVMLTVAWELCWYRYEVDLADEDNGVRVGDQGYELSELEAGEQVANAAADERGGLQPAAA